MNVEEFFKLNRVRYETMLHRPAYDAQRLAQAVHVTGENVAKTVMLRADGKYVLAVLQATHQIDMPRLKQALGVKRLELATEMEFIELFPDCDLASLPPFGSQYDMSTIVDEALTHDKQIVIRGNNEEEAFRIRYEDYEALERPRVASFSHHV